MTKSLGEVQPPLSVLLPKPLKALTGNIDWLPLCARDRETFRPRQSNLSSRRACKIKRSRTIQISPRNFSFALAVINWTPSVSIRRTLYYTERRTHTLAHDAFLFVGKHGDKVDVAGAGARRTRRARAPHDETTYSGSVHACKREYIKVPHHQHRAALWVHAIMFFLPPLRLCVLRPGCD